MLAFIALPESRRALRPDSRATRDGRSVRGHRWDCGRRVARGSAALERRVHDRAKRLSVPRVSDDDSQQRGTTQTVNAMYSDARQARTRHAPGTGVPTSSSDIQASARRSRLRCWRDDSERIIHRHISTPTRLEIVISLLTGPPCDLAIAWPDWLEEAFRFDPDNRSGWAERLIVLAFANPPQQRDSCPASSRPGR
jgi:hypothetical protein